MAGRNEVQAAEKVADHYNQRTNQTAEEREASPIIYLKKLNNWIKSVLIKTYCRRDQYVLDLACGKGGDLTKWEKADIAFYAGVDIAVGSVNDARMRYNGDVSFGKKRGMRFPAKFLHADCFGVSILPALDDNLPFDVVSCQFAFHYSFQSERRVRLGLKNISESLKPGGFFFGTIPDANVMVKKLRTATGTEFGNRVYKLTFPKLYSKKSFSRSSPFGIEYNFHLEDAVDCPEWLVPFDVFQAICLEYDLVLEMKSNFHKFIHDNIEVPEFAFLMSKIVGPGWDQKISDDEWDAAYLYLAFAFRKKGNVLPTERRKLPPSSKVIGEDDIVSIT